GRAAQGVDFNLLDGRDVFYGTDDLLEWNVTARGAGALPEATITLDFFENPENPATPEDADLWIDLNQTAQLAGVDEIRGGDSDDRLTLGYAPNLTVAIKGSEDNAELEITGGGTGLFKADDIEFLIVTGAGSVLDYSTQSYDVSVDFGLGTASGFLEVLGFVGVRTGSGDDEVIAAADTILIETGAGADTITLTRFTNTASVDAGAGDDILIGDTDARSDRVAYVDDDDFTTAEPDFDADGNPIERDPVTGLPINGPYQITNPLGSRFQVNVLDGNGADGVFTAILPTGVAQGASVSFANVESIEGQGSSGDEDQLVMNLGGGGSVVWNVTTVYEGVIVAGGASLAYSTIARGQNTGTRPLTLSYFGDAGNNIGTYDGDVIVDLSIEEAAGFLEFKGDVRTLIGTNKNDALLGNAATLLIEAHDGDDQLGLVTLAGAAAQGGSGTDTIAYRSAEGTVTLTNGALAQTGSSADGSANLLGISKAVILTPQTTTTAVTINAAAFTGGTTLHGGAGNDFLTSGLGADNGFIGSAGNDRMTNSSASAAFYVVTDVAGNRVVRDSVAAGVNIEITSSAPSKIDSLIGVFNEIRLAGDDNANIFNVSALTSASVLLIGNGGNDTLIGGSLADTLTGGEGRDSFTGGGGNDLLKEDGFRSYDLTAGGLYHDSATDTDYTLALTLPASSGADDSFRLNISGLDGIEMTTAALGFDATTAQVQTAIQALRQFDTLAYDLTIVRDGDDKITSITMTFENAFGGRDLGLAMSAAGTWTPSAGSQTAFTANAVATAGARADARETISGIESAAFSFQTDVPGWADVDGWSGAVSITGSARIDHVTLGANDSADLGEGDDFLNLTGAGPLSAGVVLAGGDGFDRLRVSAQTSQVLTDATVTLTAGAVNHTGFEDFHLIGTGGDDNLDASGLNAGALTASTQLSTLNAGAGLPIRASDNDQLSVVNRDPTTGNPLAPASFDTGETAYDLKVIHPDDSVAYVDLTADAPTMQDVLDEFNAVTGLSAVITNGELIITSSVAGTGDLRFEGVEIDNSTTQGNSGTVQDIYVDTSMLEALGLSDVAFSGASVTSSMGSGISALIDGTAGADTIVGSAGSDLLIAGSGADVVTGGAGKDHLILSTTGTAGDFVFTATTATVASALTATFSGVEIIEARGDSSAQAVDAAALTGKFIYRTGGGADTITKAAGKDTIIVERSSGTLTMPTINVDATAANNTNDQVFVELSGTFSGDLSSILTGIT
ncbi:MAG: hypothetical protein P8H53_10535, partial [Paracoccaceae bacterium]|nr:hypothetical protein [Paracoccaceae bacterium]